MTIAALRQSLVEIYRSTLRGVDLASLTEDYVRSLPAEGEVSIVAAGKASVAMAQGALRAVENRLKQAMVVTTDGTSANGVGLPVRFASHPLPDDRSLEAGTAALAIASSIATTEVLLVLISGGASALLCVPAHGLSIHDKRETIAALLSSGASINELNTIRRHLSRVKGGKLAAASKGKVFTAVISDVIGGGIHDIGSGPSTSDPTTKLDAQRLLRKYLGHARASALEQFLTEAPEPSARTSGAILLDPQQHAELLAHALASQGFKPTLESIESASIQTLSERIVQVAHTLSKSSVHVIVCEPTAALKGHTGRGGRAGWVALRSMADLPDGVALLCGATDGVDGSSGHGGACVSRDLAALVPMSERERALAQFDDAAVHERLGSHIDTGPTGLNFSDVYVIAGGGV